METRQENLEYNKAVNETIKIYNNLKNNDIEKQTIRKTLKIHKFMKNFLYSIIKRLFDIFVGLVGLIIMIPITAIVFILNRVNKENGPVFYEQLRIGKNGKYFKIYKFRSMVVGADKILSKYLETHPKEKEEFEQYRKLENDPRITKTGKLLRETSIDELPQCINLLKGDMSLIGPRPLVEGELDEHNGDHELYESVRPGISGWWAANGRSTMKYDERLELEYYYCRNCSIILDIKCMFKTVKAVISKSGAK